MKVRMADSTGIPVPQFIIEAETADDRMLLKAFLLFKEHASVTFVMHGYGVRDGDYTSFNFGWRLNEAPEAGA